MTLRIDHRAIRRIRRSLDLTQLQLAIAVGRSASWISLLESGFGPAPDKESVEKLARALEAPFEAIAAEEASGAH